MKKLGVLVIIFMISMLNAKGLSIVMEKDGETTSWTYTTKLSTSKKYHYFLLSPFDSYTINDYVKAEINNLAYIGNSLTSYNYQATIQMLILQYMYPDYNVYLMDGSTVFDSSSYEEEILELLAESLVTNEQDGTYLEVNYNERFTYRADLDGYSAKNIYASYATYIGFYGLTELGVHDIYIYVSLYKSGNYVYAIKSMANSFYIHVNVLGNTLNFNISDDDEFIFNVYKSDGTYLDTITVNKDNTTYIYKKGIDIYLEDITESNTYLALSNIEVIEEEDTDYYTVTLSAVLKPVSIEFKTYYKDYLDNTVSIETTNDISILNSEGEVIASCNGECILELTPEEYYDVVDNATGDITNIYVSEATTIELTRYLVNGLILSGSATSISIPGEFRDDIYYFDTSLAPEECSITIDNIEYLVTIDDIIINEYGVFYQVELVAEQDSSEEKDDSNSEEESSEELVSSNNLDASIELDDSVEVNVPNTGIDTINLVYDSRKYKISLVFN